METVHMPEPSDTPPPAAPSAEAQKSYEKFMEALRKEVSYVESQRLSATTRDNPRVVSILRNAALEDQRISRQIQKIERRNDPREAKRKRKLERRAVTLVFTTGSLLRVVPLREKGEAARRSTRNRAHRARPAR